MPTVFFPTPVGHIEAELPPEPPRHVFDRGTTRLTLRVPRSVKRCVEGAAHDAGQSPDEWLLQTISRGLPARS